MPGPSQVLPLSPFNTVRTRLTRHDKEKKHHNEGVAKVERRGERARDGGLVDKVVDGEEKEVEGRRSRGEERPPPPAIVLGAEMEVAEENGRLSTDYHQDDKGQHDEPKHVVHLTGPGRRNGVITILGDFRRRHL